MRKQAEPSNVSVLHIHRRLSLDKKFKKSSRKKAESNAVIHVNVRTLRKISSIYVNNSCSEKVPAVVNNRQSQQKQIKYEKSSKHSCTSPKVQQSHRFFSQSNETKQPTSLSIQQNSSLKSTVNDNSNSDINSRTKFSSSKSSKEAYQVVNNINEKKENKNEWLYENGITNDFHRKPEKNKKTKCSSRCIITSIIGVLIVLLILITIILLILFIKPKSKTTPNYIPVLRWNSTGITVAGIGSSPGNASNQLNDPADVTLDYENNLYIADRKNNRIQKYLFGNRNGTTVAGNGTYSPSQYLLANPSRVIIDSNRNLYISDTSNHRIQFWPYGSTIPTTVAGITSSWGNSSNQLYNPNGIALNPISGELYISDQFNHRIMLHGPGTNYSTLIFGGKGGGINNTQLYYPLGLHFDSFSNSLIITNSNVNNIVRYVFGATSWTLIAGNVSGFAGNTLTQLNNPYEAIYDPMGNIYVADRNNHRIQFFNVSQLNGITIAGITNVNGSNTTTLVSPRSLKLDSQLNLYVADTGNHRIQKFLRY